MRLIPSFPNAVKRSFFIEREGWDATIKVDYDDNKSVISTKRLKATAEFLEKKKIGVIRVEVAKTTHGHHLRMWLDKEIGPYTTLRIQAMLGDDPERQKFNRIRVRKKMNGWNVLFNAKYRGKTLAWKEDLDDENSKTIGKFFWKKVMQEVRDPKLVDLVETTMSGNLK